LQKEKEDQLYSTSKGFASTSWFHDFVPIRFSAGIHCR